MASGRKVKESEEKVMEQSTIAIVILVMTMLLVMNDRIPLAVTSMLAALAMSLTGIQPLGKAYAYFGNTTIVFCGATMIICNGLFETGAIQKVSDLLFRKMAQKSERALVAAISLFTGLITGFTTNSAIAATMVPVARSIAMESHGKVKAKNLLMPVGMMSTIGSPLSLSGAAAVSMARAMVNEAGGNLGFFSMAPITLILLAVSTLYFATAGYWIMKKSFDFEDPVVELPAVNMKQVPRWKPILNLVVFFLMIAGFISGIWNVAIVSLLCVAVLCLTHCISMKAAIRSCDWNVLIVMAGVTSMANGLDASGAGKVIAHAFLQLMGGSEASLPMMMVAMGLVGWFLSQFMSNTAANAIVIPIALSLGMAMNINVLYFCVPVIIGTAIAITTPLASPTTVIVMQGGFRFKDFVKVGIPLSIILLLIMFLLSPLFFPA